MLNELYICKGKHNWYYSYVSPATKMIYRECNKCGKYKEYTYEEYLLKGMDKK